jgi:hypothetical protein
MGILRLRNEKNSFYTLSDNMINLGNSFFIIEVGSIPEAPKQIPGTDFLAVMCREMLKMIHFNLFMHFEYLLQPLNTLLQRKKILFGRIDTNGYYNLVKKWQCPLYKINVAYGYRVK